MQGNQGITGNSEIVSKRVRLYEVAKELGVPNADLIAKVQSLGIQVKNHMSLIESVEIDRIKRALESEKVENQQVKRLSATVIRRRAKAKPAVPVEPVAAREVTAPAEPEPIAAAAPLSDVPSAPSMPVVVEPDEQPIETVPSAPGLDGVASEAQEIVAVQSDVVEVDDGALAAVQSAPLSAEVDVSATAETAETTAESVQEPPVQTVASGEIVSVTTEQTAELAPVDTGEMTEESEDGDKPKIRYAPGFEPGGVQAKKRLAHNKTRQQRPNVQAQTRGGLPTASGDEPLSAAEVAKMMGAGKPKKPTVVITDLDARQRFARMETMAGKRTYKPGPNQGRRGRKKKVAGSRKSRKTEITMPAEHKRVIRMEDAIGVGEIARQMGVKATDVLKKLWAMGLTKIMINQSIDADTATLLASEFGYEVEDVSFREEEFINVAEDKQEDMEGRPPVVTVMGHVDHGKTSLLDAIRGADVAAGEAGGITQHIGAYRVNTGQSDIVFIDTPGHEAFTQMRARGAQCTDIVILVVAADDGVMPQTAEAIDHAKDAGVPIIVAMNKIDLPAANPDQTMSALAERNLIPEAWGGETIFVPVSAKTKEGVETLLENVAVTAELLELKANAKKAAKGTVIEARLDRSRGPMATVLIQEGTLKVGHTVVVGDQMGKVRALIDDRGRQIDEAPPCTPVEVLGLSGVPEAADTLNGFADEKAARTVTDHRRQQTRRKELAGASAGKSFEEILGDIRSGDVKEIKLLVKADVAGSAEATKDALLKLSTEKVTVNVISAGVGGVTETDVNLAKAAQAVILGFNVRPAGKANQLAEREGVEIRIYDVIYEMQDEVKELMRGLLPKERREKMQGRAEVRETFTIPKIGTIAGCSVIDGKVTRKSHLRLVRDDVKIYDGKVGSLRRFKDDVKEVVQGYECGIGIDGYNDIRVSDVIEAYEIEEIAPVL